MRRTSRPLLRLTAATATVTAAAAIAIAAGGPASAHDDGHHRSSDVVVANRGSGDVSVIDGRTLAVDTIDLPGDAEPMYVNHDPRQGLVFVGDRAASTVVALDDHDYSVVDSIDVGDGVFHQWVDPTRRQLWVVGDTSNTVSVVDTRHLDVVATIDIPADLVARGGRPHDVFAEGRHAFVSIIGLDDGSGAVIQYSTRTFAETARITTGGDPHLFVRSGSLYVASQDASTVTRYRARDLAELGQADVPAAHGIFVTRGGEVFTTNIAGGGVDALWELQRNLGVVVDVTDTDAPVPHNVAVDGRRQAFVTHSGATADQVSVIDLDGNGFGARQLVTVGTNPFGLAVVD